MIFWKRVKQAINDLWYPRSVTVGKPVETQELANRIARESTVSPADTHAVLRALPNIMADFMKESRAVHFEGLGWFRYTTVSAGNGVATKEEVTKAMRHRCRTTRTTTADKGLSDNILGPAHEISRNDVPALRDFSYRSPSPRQGGHERAAVPIPAPSKPTVWT